MKTLLASIGVALMLAALYFFSTRSTARPSTGDASPAQPVLGTQPGISKRETRTDRPRLIQPFKERHAEIDRSRLAGLAPTTAGNKAARTFDDFVQRAGLSNEQRSRMLGLYWDLKLVQEAAMDADFLDFIDMYHHLGSKRTAAVRAEPGYKSLIAQAREDLRDEAERRAREILTPEQYEIYDATGVGLQALIIARDLPLADAP